MKFIQEPLITHKKRTVNIRGKVVKLPKEEQFIFENHHEAIISKRDIQFSTGNKD